MFDSHFSSRNASGRGERYRILFTWLQRWPPHHTVWVLPPPSLRPRGNGNKQWGGDGVCSPSDGNESHTNIQEDSHTVQEPAPPDPVGSRRECRWATSAPGGTAAIRWSSFFLRMRFCIAFAFAFIFVRVCVFRCYLWPPDKSLWSTFWGVSALVVFASFRTSLTTKRNENWGDKPFDPNASCMKNKNPDGIVSCGGDIISKGKSLSWPTFKSGRALGVKIALCYSVVELGGSWRLRWGGTSIRWLDIREINYTSSKLGGISIKLGGEAQLREEKHEGASRAPPSHGLDAHQRIGNVDVRAEPFWRPRALPPWEINPAHPPPNTIVGAAYTACSTDVRGKKTLVQKYHSKLYFRNRNFVVGWLTIQKNFEWVRDGGGGDVAPGMWQPGPLIIAHN